MTEPPAVDLGPVDRLVELAGTLAGAWGARARTCTTAGQERAILRMFGVAGLDRTGQPLASEVVERYVLGRPDRLAGGIALPFAAALVEYETTPQELALDVASGAVDLGLEAEVLRDAGRRASAEALARQLGLAALERIDANRTARLELLDVLGDSDRPWVGAILAAPDLRSAGREATMLATSGVDVVEVSVPALRELADHLHDQGLDVPFWRPRRGQGGPPPEPMEPAPAGSQRGLAALRQAVDAIAAERRSYARLATVALPLAAPEQALVAAFERIDVVAADVVAEIVDGRVDPDRALADHAFAQRIVARSGASLLIGPGPLVVAPDLARGVPSDGATRAGRALALQLVGVRLAALHGLTGPRILAGALPIWLLEERDATVAAIAQVVVRRAAMPDVPLAFEEPPPGTLAAVVWPSVLAAVLPVAGPTGLIVRATGGDAAPEAATATRATAASAAEAAGSLGPLEPRGPALEHARATVAAAMETLERLASRGWPSVLGASIAGADRGRLGADAVVERSESFDPFELR